MNLPFKHPPKHLCILRLSAIGDVCHTLPIVRTIQKYWPETQLTWIIGKTEHALVNDIENIHFIVFDKSNKFQSYKSIYKHLKKQQFDALLHMQMSLRSSLISLLVKSKIKLGFDKKRAKDAQWLFSNNKIPYQPKQHVVDSFFGFTKTLGIDKQEYQWNIPNRYSQQELQDSLSITKIDFNKPFIIISPCSSMAYRNWLPESYAAVADKIQQQYKIPILLSGGTSSIEYHMGKEIENIVQYPVINLIGQTDLKQLLSLLKFSYCVISPDSGPAHIATAVNTPVIGLYACTNPERARPYCSAQWTVNRYPEAIQRKLNCSVDDVNWGTRVRDDWAMKLITIDDVVTKFEQLFVANPV